VAVERVRVGAVQEQAVDGGHVSGAAGHVEARPAVGVGLAAG
jgi:hypothetical protein